MNQHLVGGNMKFRIILCIMIFGIMSEVMLPGSEEIGYRMSAEQKKHSPPITVGASACCPAMQGSSLSGIATDVHVVPVALSNAGEAQKKQEQKINMDEVHKFWMAVADGQLELVKSFLKAGMSPNASRHCSEIPLITAIYKKHFEIAAVLIDAGANVNAADCWGRTPLLAAIWSRDYNPNMVKKLIKLNVNLNAKETQNGSTPLMLAISAGLPDMVELLLKSGAHVDEKDRDGSTAFLRTIDGCDRIDFAQTLLKAGTDINAKDRYGCTALMKAAINEMMNG